MKAHPHVQRWPTITTRPPITVTVRHVHHGAWAYFARHHYLTRSMPVSARCFVGYIEGRPACFESVMPLVGKVKGFRACRVVTVPDYQGVGIGARVDEFIAACYRTVGERFFLTTGHPSFIRSRVANPLWRTISTAQLRARASGNRRGTEAARTRAWDRAVASFEYIGPRVGVDLAEAFTGRSAPRVNLNG